MMPACPECGEELDFLDTIVARSTGRAYCRVYTCRNDECDDGGIFHIMADDRTETLKRGDPSGNY